MISIIIPTYNEEKYVSRILKSLADMEMGNDLEVVIADANSSDKTREVAKSYAQHFGQLIIVEGGMPAIGRNNGAKASYGDPIFFIDADMEIRNKEFFIANLNYFKKHNLAAATTKLIPISDKWIDYFLIGMYNLILKPAAYIRPLGSMCIVASREAFQKTGGYPEDVVMSEDHDFVLACSKIGKYGILPISIYMSVRRFNKEGRLGLVLKYLQASALRVFKGPIKKFDYKFGYTEDDYKKDNLQ